MDDTWNLKIWTSIMNLTNYSENTISDSLVPEECEENRSLKHSWNCTSVHYFSISVLFTKFNFSLFLRYSQFVENYYLDILKNKMRAKFKSLSPSKNASKLLESSRRSLKSKQTKVRNLIYWHNLHSIARVYSSVQVKI